MNNQRNSLVPGQGTRPRLSLQGEFLLALLPTLTVLLVLAFVNALSQQRVLYASLASSAFLIYLDPRHAANRMRTLVIAQLMAAALGLGAYLVFGSHYWAGGLAMVLTIILMILLDAVHPPAIGTSLIFAFRAGSANNMAIFLLAVLMTVILIILQRVLVWLLDWSIAGFQGKP